MVSQVARNLRNSLITGLYQVGGSDPPATLESLLIF